MILSISPYYTNKFDSHSNLFSGILYYSPRLQVSQVASSHIRVITISVYHSVDKLQLSYNAFGFQHFPMSQLCHTIANIFIKLQTSHLRLYAINHCCLLIVVCISSTFFRWMEPYVMDTKHLENPSSAVIEVSFTSSIFLQPELTHLYISL